MEFGTREWLTLIIIVLIVIVLLDGVRRMRRNRREALRMSLHSQQGQESEDEYFGSELPSGGARVVSRRNDADTRELTLQLKRKHHESKTTLGMPRIPQQVVLNLDDEVPVLMDTAAKNPADKTARSKRRGRVEPTFSDEPVEQDSAEQSSVKQSSVKQSSVEQRPQPDRDAPEVADSGEHHHEPIDDERDPLFAEMPATEECSQDELFEESGEPEPPEEPDEVLVINVMAPGGARFNGGDLLEVALECGLRYGDMQIFHRHEQQSGSGYVQFSMVNMVKPGTFDLQNMADFDTPGVSLFMTLPMPCNSVEAFNSMALTASKLAERLGAELKDETRSAMTNQTLEHCRQRIIEYERKRQLSAAH